VLSAFPSGRSSDCDLPRTAPVLLRRIQLPSLRFPDDIIDADDGP